MSCKMKSVLFLLSFLFVLSGIIQAQPEVKHGFKVGVEFANYLSSESGSLNKVPGISAGLYTEIMLRQRANSALQLAMELNYVKLLKYYPNDRILSRTNYGLYEYVYDKRYELSFFEIVLAPQLLFSVGENMSIGIYAGPSIGFGSEWLTPELISRTMVDSVRYYDPFGYGPYGEANMNDLRTPITLNIGASVFYEFLMFDLRSRFNDYYGVFLQVGLAL